MLTVVTRHGNEWSDAPDGACVFVPLVGAGGYAAVTPARQRHDRPVALGILGRP